MCEKNVQICCVHIMENTLNVKIFIHALHNSKLAPLIFPGSIYFENLFPQQQKGVEETMICFIKI